MSTQRFWEALPHGDFANRGDCGLSEAIASRLFARDHSAIATSGQESRLGEIVESHPLGPNEDITLRTKEIRSTTNSDTIKSGLSTL